MSAVLVTGATGTVGSAVVRELLARGATVRAFVRDPEAARERLGDRVELAAGDLGDPAALRRALRGADRLFLACGNVPGQVELETAAIEAARTASVRHVVKLSALGAGAGSPVSFWDWQGRIERRLTDSGLAATVLRPTSYMTNLLPAAPAIARTGMLFAPAAGARIAMIDPRDVAAVAAVALTEPGHEERVYELTGPAALTYDDVAAALSEATGRPIAFVAVPDDQARLGLLESGMPPYLADFLVALFAAQREGAAARVTDTVRAVTGRAPNDIAKFASQQIAAFRAAAPAGT